MKAALTPEDMRDLTNGHAINVLTDSDIEFTIDPALHLSDDALDELKCGARAFTQNMTEIELYADHIQPSYGDVTYEVTLTIADDASLPSEQEIAQAIWQGVSALDSVDAILVWRQ